MPEDDEIPEISLPPSPDQPQCSRLRQIDNAIAFDDESKVSHLVIEGYVEKDGDLFQLTPKGEKCLLDNGVGMNIR